MTSAVWLVIRTIQWGVTLCVAVLAVRLASALIAAWRPPATGQRRRDGRWLFGWLVMLALSLALLHCQVGGYYGFRDPWGGDWDFEGHGWPLTEPQGIFERSGGSSAGEAIYWLAIAADLVCSVLLLAATRIVADRWIAAYDAPARWPALRKEAAGWCIALLAVLACERLAARPITLPGSELIVYSTLFYELPEVRAGMLIGLASAAYLVGLSVALGIRTLKRLRDEGVV